MSAWRTPTCPDCGAPMRAANRREGGQSFWGCSRYPACRGSRPMPGLTEQLGALFRSLASAIRHLTQLLRRPSGR